MSSRPGELALANPARTRSGSSPSVDRPGPRVTVEPSSFVVVSETPANASTAASAQAALEAWYAPNSGRYTSA